VYDFGFWEARRPPGAGAARIGASEHPRHRRTAAGAKDSLFARLALLEKSTKVPGERELCRRLLGTWKATAAMRMQDFVFWEEKGIWSAVARHPGRLRDRPDGHAAKDDLVEALKAMFDHLEDVGESKKAAVCGRW